jgi:outer membrane biosynthesis protein TonB
VAEIHNEYADLTTEIAAHEGARDSTIALLNAIGERLSAAVNTATKAGATPEQLLAISAEIGAIQQSSAAMGAAVAAEPEVEEPEPTPEPTPPPKPTPAPTPPAAAAKHTAVAPKQKEPEAHYRAPERNHSHGSSKHR